MNFKNALPEFCEEVRLLLIRMERSDLAVQLKNLSIDWRCPCTDFGCASFTVSGGNPPDTFELTQERRSASAELINLGADRGKISLRIDPLGRIKAFEVLNRPEVRRKLMRAR